MWTMAECPQLLAQNLNLGELCSSGGQNLLVIHHSEAILDSSGTTLLCRLQWPGGSTG